MIPKAHVEQAHELEELGCSLDFDGGPYESGPFGEASGAPVAGRRGDIPGAAATADLRRQPIPARAARPGEPAQLGRQGDTGGHVPQARRSRHESPAPARQSRGSVRQAAARLASAIPTARCIEPRGLLRAALARGGARQRRDFFAVARLSGQSADASTVQTHYVEHLRPVPQAHASTCPTGPTATPGAAARSWPTVKQRYRRSAASWSTPRGELPDYLPMVLEYAAIVDPVDGTALLQQYRRSLELLRLALVERGTPYAGVLAAVCATLPGPSPADRQAVMAMAAAGPPTETVGLEPTTPGSFRSGGASDECAAVGRAALRHAGRPDRRHSSGATATTSSAGPPAPPSCMSHGCCGSARRCSTSASWS